MERLPQDLLFSIVEFFGSVESVLNFVLTSEKMFLAFKERESQITRRVLVNQLGDANIPIAHATVQASRKSWTQDPYDSHADSCGIFSQKTPVIGFCRRYLSHINDNHHISITLNDGV